MDLNLSTPCGGLDAKEKEGNKKRMTDYTSPIIVRPYKPPRPTSMPPRSPLGQQQQWTSIG